MQVSFEALDGLKRQFTATFPADQADKLRQAEAQKLSKQVRLQGFRPGKAPVKMVQKMYKSDINGKVLNVLFEEAFKKVQEDNDFRMAGQPMIEKLEMEDQQPVEIVASFEVYPEFTIKKIDGIEVEQVITSLTEENRDEMIDRLRKQRATFEESTEAATDGDRLTIDFVGKIDGEAFEGGSAEDMAIEVGAGRMLPEFDAALAGMKAGDEKSVEVLFPEDYPAETLQGKTANFVITAKKLERAELPEVDEAFVKSFNIESVEQFKQDLMSNMSRELDERVLTKNKEAVLNAWLAENPIDVPTALIEQEVKVIAQNMGIGDAPDGMSAEDHQKAMNDAFSEQAKRRVSLGLLMGNFVNENEIKVDEKRMEEKLESLAASYEDPTEVQQHYKTDHQARASLQALVLEDQVVDMLRDGAKIVTVEKSFKEMVE